MPAPAASLAQTFTQHSNAGLSGRKPSGIFTILYSKACDHVQAGGALIGPHALGIIQDVEGVRHLAELGVVFLLFNIGLELSLERLRSMQKYVFGMGTAQVGLTASISNQETVECGQTVMYHCSPNHLHTLNR